MSSKLHLKKLDEIRGFAALYVVLYHLVPRLNCLPEKIIQIFFSYGQEAVMLFFLLSGFVIYISVYNKPQLSFKDYFLRRFRRIYFPFILAIILSIIVSLINGKFYKQFDWQELLGNLLMLQDYANKPGTLFRPFMGNFPLWSLAYEWWFYLIFFPIHKYLFKLPGRIYYIFSISFLAYSIYIFIPNQFALYLAYFIVWWCGVEAADIYIHTRRFTYQRMKPILICLFFMTLLSAIPVVISNNIQLGYYPFLMLRHFSIVFISMLIGLIWYQHKLVFFENIFGIFYALAPISYGIYIFHYPILAKLDLNQNTAYPWLVYSIELCLILGLSYLVEIKLQPLINSWIK